MECYGSIPINNYYTHVWAFFRDEHSVNLRIQRFWKTRRTWTLLRYSSSAGCVHTLCPWRPRFILLHTGGAMWLEGNKLHSCGIQNFWSQHQSTSPISINFSFRGEKNRSFQTWNILDVRRKNCSYLRGAHLESGKLPERHIAFLQLPNDQPGLCGSWSKRFHCPNLYLGPLARAQILQCWSVLCWLQIHYISG